MNCNGQIDWNDADRIVSNDTRYVSFDGDGNRYAWDPIEESDSENLYAFCGEAPIQCNDLRGEMAILVPAVPAIGVAVGALLKAAIAAAMASMAMELAVSRAKDKCSFVGCRPCVPPVSTLGYRIDPVPPGRPHGPYKTTHTHIRVVMQSPPSLPKGGCRCFWNDVGVIDGDRPPDNAVEMDGDVGGDLVVIMNRVYRYHTGEIVRLGDNVYEPSLGRGYVSHILVPGSEEAVSWGLPEGAVILGTEKNDALLSFLTTEDQEDIDLLSRKNVDRQM